jgi:uncharacterized protein (DUF1800 family)
MPLRSALLLLLVGPAASIRAQGEARPEPIPWDARHAEHLLNRAGFGGDSATVARAVEVGLEATLEELLAFDPWLAEPFYARKRFDPIPAAERQTPEARKLRARQRAEDSEQRDDFGRWWLGRMVRGEAPLVERMTLFWHGHFTSSFREVKSSYELIQQNQTFREHALGSFRDLLAEMIRDPALLIYLDNDENRKGKPNENFARELLELFTLGEGNYTEEDVREVARAFTGWGVRQGQFRLNAKQHDRGRKTVLGRSGRLDGQDVADIVLGKEQCARYLAGELLAYFEGVTPEPERVERYARTLFEDDYRIDHLLARLFRDPEFYRDEVLGTRIASPVDYLVGTVRRLGLDVPAESVFLAASLLGERLFAPPSVQGWEGGVAWVAACPPDWPGLMSAFLIGGLDGEALTSLWVPEPPAEAPIASDEGPGAAMEGEVAALDEGAPRASRARTREELRVLRRRMPEEVKRLTRLDLHPRLNLTRRMELLGAQDDATLALALSEDVLALPPGEALVAELQRRIRSRRETLGLAESELLTRPMDAEPLLRELAAEILAQPEARLH